MTSKKNPQYDRETCYFCHETDTHILETHHIVPRRFGGSDDCVNLVRVCPTCHEKLERLYDARFFDRVGVDAESNTDDKSVDVITADDQLESIQTVKSVIANLSEDAEDAKLTDVHRVAHHRYGFDHETLVHEIGRLKDAAEIYEPKHNFLRIV